MTGVQTCALPILRGGADPSGGATVIRCISPFGEFARQRGGREYRAVRTAKYTYARDLKGPWLLYDNEADPFQLTNLVNNIEVQGKLESLLSKKLAEQKDEFLPGPKYIEKWAYKVDANETAIYKP